jgi:hypothetical protein
MGNRTTADKRQRNIVIKIEVQAELELGLSLKEAIYVVADRFYLSYSSVEKIYYDQRIE